MISKAQRRSCRGAALRSGRSCISVIPDLFAAKNAHEAFHNWNTGYYYSNIITGGEHGKASDCIKCGKCEKVCPQHLPIRQFLQDVARTFES